MFNKKQREIERLRYRVKELEERICPCESHEWVKINTRYIYIGDIEPVHDYRCKKCGKEKSDFF